MKKKQREAYRSQSIDELAKDVQKEKQELALRRMEVKTGRVKNTDLSRLSDNIAVMSTYLAEKKYKEKKA